MRNTNKLGLDAKLAQALNRRQFLRGAGVCVALPVLPSLVPSRLLAKDRQAAAAATQVGGGVPQRMAFVTIPNGVNLDRWWPKGDGRAFELAPTMAPLTEVKQYVQVISGLDHINATAGKDGAGDHARASASLLTGCRAKKTAGADIFLGPSVDQVAAQRIGHLTRLPSLELTTETRRPSGDCDSGYACAYQFSVSWRSATTPMAAESNPRKVFERLFGGGTDDERATSLAFRQQANRSILDFIRDDANSLNRKLNRRDGQKLDEYLTSLRDVEQRIARLEQAVDIPANAVKPTDVPNSFGSRLDAMFDMIVLAFQTDSTRIATLILAHDGSNQRYPDIGVDEGHHELSHHQNKPETLEKIAKIDRYHIEHFARFLGKLAAAKDADGNSVLHNSMILYAGGNADGNAHSHTNLPVILAGAGGGKLQAGRFHKVPSMPMANMYVEMLANLGLVGITRFGDSNDKQVGV